MTGPVSIFAIAEMNQRAEDAAKQVRGELFRIGCAPGKIQLLRQGYYLQLRYRRQIILADPGEVLNSLRTLPDGLDESEVWDKVVDDVRRIRKISQQRITWSIVSVLIILTLVVFWLLFQG